VATGIVLGAALGLSALLLYFDSIDRSTTGATVTVLFGSLFTVDPSLVPVMAGLAAAGVVAAVVMYRPLLLASVDADLARVRGVRVRAVGFAFLVVMGVTVSLSSMVVGTVLSPALLIGPPAVALRLTRRPATAMILAAAVGVAAVWLGVVLAWMSANWPPSHDGWPVSFFVVALLFSGWLVVELGSRLRRD
jgi:zinc/manganese transport system permease protein